MNLRLLIFIGILTLLLVVINILLSQDIVDWVPSLKKKIYLFVCLWCVPLIGALVIYRHLNLDWFSTSGKNSGDGSSIGSGMLGADAIFNPGTKHIIDTMQEEYAEVREDGQLYKSKNIDGLEVTLSEEEKIK